MPNRRSPKQKLTRTRSAQKTLSPQRQALWKRVRAMWDWSRTRRFKAMDALVLEQFFRPEVMRPLKEYLLERYRMRISDEVGMLILRSQSKGMTIASIAKGIAQAKMVQNRVSEWTARSESEKRLRSAIMLACARIEEGLHYAKVTLRAQDMGSKK